jgi:isoleucyl-tRNA synthetase
MGRRLISDGGPNYVIATDMIGIVAMRGWLDTTKLNVPIWRGKGSDLAGTIARHPIYNFLRHSREGGNPTPNVEGRELDPRLRGSDEAWERALAFYEKPRPFLPGEFVTTEQGTGLVHMAPDHGEDDFELCKANGNAPDGPICEDLRAAGALLAASADYKHSYPHSWRSKAKVIFRATPQWFIPVDLPLAPLPEGRGDSPTGERGRVSEPSASEHPHPLADASRLPLEGEGKTLRETALSEIDRVRFVPEKGRNRIGAMVEGRPDWVISRQRAWGVPITLFVDRKSGQYLCDPQVNARIVAAIREKGVDAWTAEAAQGFLGDAYNAADYEQVTDILDVWFDSGCTHAFVLESGKWPDLQWPADLYLEGSDQHRGWFQSSLLQSCGTRGRAPYDTVLTHGFTMDAKGMKMSKSVGNTIDPLKVMETNGADIIRLWALSVDFTEDHRIGDEILKGVADQYRKLRNTFRYLLGALDGFDWKDAVSFAQGEMPELECYILHLLAELDGKLRTAIADYDFNSYTRLLSEFANNDLSAFYFDIRKDSLYCDGANDMRRRANLTVLTILFDALVRYAAPVLVFTAEEVWQSRYPDSEGSVHMLEMPNIDLAWRNPVLNTKWNLVRSIRNEITGHLEPLRRDKIIGSSLQADVSVRLAHATDDFNLCALDWAEIAIVSAVDFGLQAPIEQTEPRYWVEFESKVTDNHKCGRCWRHLPEVSEDGALCGRCAEVVNG